MLHPKLEEGLGDVAGHLLPLRTIGDGAVEYVIAIDVMDATVIRQEITCKCLSCSREGGDEDDGAIGGRRADGHVFRFFAKAGAAVSAGWRGAYPKRSAKLAEYFPLTPGRTSARRRFVEEMAISSTRLTLLALLVVTSFFGCGSALKVPPSGPVRSNFVRLVKAGPTKYDLQTADVRLSLRDDSRGGSTFFVDLLSTVHVADHAYYSGLQARGEEYDRVLFEMIVDDSLVTTEADAATGNTIRRLSTPLRAAPALATLAERNGLDTQVEALDCTRPRWVLADVTRRQLAVQEARLQEPGLATGRNTLAGPVLSSLASPLRLLLVGPAGSSKNSRGSALRPLLSVLPAPEIALLLDDWITSGGPELSPAIKPLAAALGRLDLGAARRLSFAQTLAAGETTQEGSLAGALVRWRNACAVDAVEAARAAGCSRLALVYGALHMRDLRSRLLQRYTLLEVGAPTWRTAWSVAVASDGAGEGTGEAGGGEAALAAQGSGGSPGEVERGEADGSVRSVLTLAAFTFGLLIVDAFDWIDATEAIVRALAGPLSAAVAILGDDGGGLATAGAAAEKGAASAAALEAVLYAARHALLYLALQRWAFEWDSRWWAVEAGDEA